MDPVSFLSAKIDSDDTEDLLMTILTSHLFMALCFFFLICTSHGNDTIGQRFATFTFFPMKENETLLSSFLANTAFRVFVVTGVRQYTTLIFASWTRGSISYQQAVIARNSEIFFKIADISFFDYIFIISVIVTCITIAFKGSGRIRYNDIIEEKGVKQGG